MENLVFKCPKCGGSKLEEVMTDVTVVSELKEIVKGDSIFCASGITSSEVIKGIVIEGDKFISETLVTHKNNNFKEIVKSVNSINE